MSHDPLAMTFSVVKAGNTDDENEDFADFRVDDGRLQVAIADGATDAGFSRAWARALVTERLRQPAIAVEDVIVAARVEWERSLPAKESLPWFGQAKLEEGSAATFMGVLVWRTTHGWAWAAESVGDCELFAFSGSHSPHFRRAVPLRRHEEFGSRPVLLQTDRRPEVVTFSGHLQPPAEIWVSTDAFAEACLRALDTGQRPWDEWRTVMKRPEAFRELVAVWRDAKRMKNDDVTVVCARLT